MSAKLPYIKKGFTAGMDFKSSATYSNGATLYIYIIGIVMILVILVLRLFQLTIVKGAYYRNLSENNRIHHVLIESQRGTLIDRKGLVIADNSAADINAVGDRLYSRRSYRDAEAMAPLIGYRQLADKNDFETDPCFSKLQIGDMIGKKGVEKKYECDLRGKAGQKLIEINAQGKPLKTLAIIPPIAGKTIRLAVDMELQKKAYDLLQGKKGAVIGIKPQTGEVLVLASAPSFNPQLFEDNNQKVIQAYIADSNKPLFNRALEGAYPPGSTFKLIVAAGALQEKKITPDTLFNDTGTLTAGSLTFGNWYYLEYGKTEGEINIARAIARSTDTFFYQAGAKLGPEDIKNWSERFGLGSPTGIGIDEVSGSVPSPYWKEDVLKEQWFLGDTYNESIGQGYMLVTPMQIAQVTSAIANNGTLCSPQLLKTPDTEKGNCRSLKLSPSTLSVIKQGMTQACSSGGTAYPLFDFSVKQSGKTVPLQTACKTGTAESNSDAKNPHAWFTIFAPAQNPEIVLTVLVEQSGQGADIAAPIARDLLTAYFERSQ